jgi:hypothetical protein
VVGIATEEYPDLRPDLAVSRLFAVDEQEGRESGLSVRVSVAGRGHDDEPPVVQFITDVGGCERTW